MIDLIEVKTKKQQKLFVDFPNDLYKDNPYYVPYMTEDELNIFNPKKNANYDECDTVYYLAYEDGILVGRIAGIIQHTYNEKVDQRRARFSRFDCINNFDVAKALFKAVEKWASSKGMVCVHGPMGFNDEDRAGLLIEGFDKMATVATNYNFSYYKDFVNKLGYKKESDWIEYKIIIPKEKNEKVDRIANLVAQRYKLHTVEEKSTSKIIKKYASSIFNLLNETYAPLYGMVPINEKAQKALISQFKLICNSRYMSLVLDEKNELVGFGLTFPCIGSYLNKTRGRIVTPHIFNLLKLIKKPKSVELAFIAVKPEYRTKGVTSLIMNRIMNHFIEDKIEFAESNPELEGNIYVRNQWDHFEHYQTKVRRAYIKFLDGTDPKDYLPKNRTEIR